MCVRFISVINIDECTRLALQNDDEKMIKICLVSHHEHVIVTNWDKMKDNDGEEKYFDPWRSSQSGNVYRYLIVICLIYDLKSTQLSSKNRQKILF